MLAQLNLASVASLGPTHHGLERPRRVYKLLETIKTSVQALVNSPAWNRCTWVTSGFNAHAHWSLPVLLRGCNFNSDPKELMV